MKKLLEKIFKIKMKTSILILLPLWSFTAYFIYTSYYLELKNPYHRLYQPTDEIFRKELLHLYLYSEFVRLKNWTSSEYKEKSEIPVINLYFKQNDLEMLFRNLPESGKEKYIKGKLGLGDEILDIEARIRGGNYWHWFYAHKSWRIKVLNGKKIFNLSEVDIVNPKLVFSSNDALAMRFAAKIGLPEVENRAVRLNINGKYSGVSFTLSLLNNDFMDQNQMSFGALYGIDIDSPVAKDPIFTMVAAPWFTGRDWMNFVNRNYKKNKGLELYELSKVLRSVYKNDFYNFFNMHFNKENVYKLMALDSILGIYHRSNLSSQRFYFDNKSGKFSMIPWDFLMWIHEQSTMFSRNPIYDRVRLAPRLNYEYLKKIYEVLRHQLDKKYLVTEIKNECQKIKNSVFDDPNKDAVSVHRMVVANYTQIFPFDNDYFLQSCDYYVSHIEKRLDFLERYFNTLEIESLMYWKDNITHLLLTNQTAITPILNKIDSDFDIYYDSNNNHKFDKNDQKVDFNRKNGRYLFSVNGKGPHKTKLRIKDFYIFFGRDYIDFKKVSYLFFIKKKIHHLKISLKNALTDKTIEIVSKLEKEKRVPFYGTFYTLDENAEKPLVLGPGVIHFNKTQIFSRSVEIKAGTHFLLGDKVSLIFKNKVMAKGLLKKPIKFSSLGINPFGSIILRDEKINNSIFENVIIENGDESFHELTEYPGIFNIVGGKNIKLQNFQVKSSCANCMGIHIYRSHNFDLKNVTLANFKNSIVGIYNSNGLIENSHLGYTLENAIDSKYSDITVNKSEIYNFFKSGINADYSKVLLRENIIKNGLVGVKENFKNAVIKDTQFKGVSKRVLNEK